MQLVHNGFGRDGDNGEHRVEVGRRSAAAAVWGLVCYYLHASATLASPFPAGQGSSICLELPHPDKLILTLNEGSFGDFSPSSGWND